LEHADFESWAARQQPEVTEEDNELWKLTESAHPLVHFWWNRRVKGFKTGAYCYVCDKMIATWDGKYPMTVAAINAVMEHRKKHIDKLKGGTL
jgi:hypothetical protein